MTPTNSSATRLDPSFLATLQQSWIDGGARRKHRLSLTLRVSLTCLT